jgi:hypothetical protein
MAKPTKDHRSFLRRRVALLIPDENATSTPSLSSRGPAWGEARWCVTTMATTWLDCVYTTGGRHGLRLPTTAGAGAGADLEDDRHYWGAPDWITSWCL